MSLTTKTNANFDSLGGAVPTALGGALTRVDAIADTTPNSNRKVHCTSALGVDVYISYDELADSRTRDKILRLAHAQRGVNLPNMFDIQNIIKVLNQYLTVAAGPDFTDAEYQATIDLLRTIRPMAASVPNKNEAAGQKPVAAFATSDLTGKVLHIVDSSTGDISMFLWDWGDGTYTLGDNPADHTYGTTGSKTVTLYVVGPGGTDRLVKTQVLA